MSEDAHTPQQKPADAAKDAAPKAAAPKIDADQALRSGLSDPETEAKLAEEVRKTATATAATEAGKVGFWRKTIDTAKANFAKEKGLGGKFARGAGAGLGVIVVGKGLKDFGRFVGAVSPGLDEEGKEKPTGAGMLVKSLVELGAGAGIAYVSLTQFGKSAGKA